MTNIETYILLVFGIILGLAVAGVAYHAGYFIRDMRDSLYALKKRLNALEQEAEDTTPAIVEAKTPKEEKLHKFDPEDEESAIITPLTPKEVAEAKRRQTLKEIEEAENAPG